MLTERRRQRRRPLRFRDRLSIARRSTAPVLAFRMNLALRPGYRYALLSFLLLLLQGCSGMPQRRVDSSTGGASSNTAIIVARRGWHIDVGFRTVDIRGPLAALSAQIVTSQYVFFGFGDRHYLVAKNKNFPGLLAALWPGAAVVLVTLLAAVPEEAFGSENVIRLTVSSAQAQAAQFFVWDSLLKENAVPISYGKGPYEGSLFFAAASKYSALHTCNTWAAEGLQAADLPVRSRGVLFASQLWTQAGWIEKSQRRTAAMIVRHP
jgi:uncharacterized protein (TIGR02117 family)